MNRELEFRRLRWLMQVQEFIANYKQQLMVTRLSLINSEEPALEFNINELERLLEAERLITELSYTYDFSEEPSNEDVIMYLVQMIGLMPSRY